MPGTKHLAPQPAPQQQVQAPRVSEIEMLLRNIEGVSATLPAHQGDVAQAQDALGTKKEDKRTLWRRISYGLIGKRWVARISKEERTRTRSDVRRIGIKARLAAIVQDFSAHAEVQEDSKFQEILTDIREYSRLDVTGVSKKQEIKDERNLFQKICNGLDEYMGNAAFQGGELISRMAVNLKIFFDSQRNGNLNVPTGEDVILVKDHMRPPALTRKVKAEVVNEQGEKETVSVNVEDKSSRSKMGIKNMEKQPLFSHEPSVNDIRQGKMGDCYLLAVLSSIVNQDPQQIRDCMRDNGDGTVFVRFYRTYQWGNQKTFKPVYVQARKVIPRYKRKEDPFARGALWVQVMERAYALARPRLDGEDRFGNKTNIRGISREKEEKYSNAKQEWQGKQTEKAKKEYLAELKKDPRNLFMFDEKGNFYQSYDQIPQEPSYADLPSGTSRKAFEHILGREGFWKWHEPTQTTQTAAEKTTSWVSAYAVHNLQQLHHKVLEDSQGGQGAPNAQNFQKVPKNNFEIMAETLLALLKNDPQTAGRNWTLEDVRSFRDDIERWQEQMVGNFDYIMQNAAADPALMSAQGKKDRINTLLDMTFRAFTSQQVDANTSNRILVLQKLYLVLKRMAEGITTAKQTNLVGAYTPEEEKTFWELKDYLDQGKAVTAGSKSSKGKKKGLYGENLNDGIFGPHGYLVLGVEQREINMGHGKVGLCKFVKVRNPWGSGAVRYSVEGGELRSSVHSSSKQGVCLIEYRQFLARFSGITVV